MLDAIVAWSLVWAAASMACSLSRPTVRLVRWWALTRSDSDAWAFEVSFLPR